QLAVSPTTVQSGDEFTITGVSTPGDVVSATLTGNGISPINLGTAEAGLDGQFAITVPNGVDIGAGGSGNGGSDDDDNDDDNGDGGSTQTYTITVKSTYCPQNKGTVSITILPLRFSGCGSNDAGRTFSA